MNEHYYVVESIDFKRCKTCGKKLRQDNENHVCNEKNIAYFKNKVCKKTEYVAMINCREKNKIEKDSMVFFDLETFQDGLSHVAYACGYCVGEQEVKIDYGEGCMNNFLNDILSYENKTICAYNGARFDFYLLIDKLTERGVDIHDIILANGSILSFKFGKNNKVFDLCRFIMSSLEDACESYNIFNKKMEFDVLKIKSWDLAEKFRHQVEPYLKYDVLSLRELFFTFNDSIFENDSVNITKFVTLSHMGYAIWSSTLQHSIELPDLEKYDFEKKGTYGGRCFPMQGEYKSKYYDDIKSGIMTYEELKNTDEYLFNADATSLYPASMSGFELCQVRYPVGKSRWSENGKEEFDKGKLGYYNIQFKCPKNIRIPVLPRKSNIGGLEWSLFDGCGVYSSVDIENAIDCGYTIDFCGKCLVWDKCGNVFGEYIQRYYKMKADAEFENNDVKRSIAKLLLNSMYGKTLQKAIFQSTTVVNNYNELLDCFRKSKIVDINIINDNKLLLTGEALNREERLTKPTQLGGFVLAYSRKIMLTYMKAIDPTLQSLCFTYTDTDSLHITAKNEKKLRAMGYIKAGKEVALGFLSSDIKEEGLIIAENNLAPKLYRYEYVDQLNRINGKKNKATLKAKGIPSKCLKYEMYDLEENEPCEFSGLKRKHVSLTKKDRESGMKHFSITNCTQSRSFNKNSWTGFNKIDNEWFPRGYEKNYIANNNIDE